jgi:predicted RNA methylase
MSNEIMNRVQIDEITAGRDGTISKWLEAYDSFHALTAEAGGLCFAGAISLPTPSDDRYSDSALTRAFHTTSDHEIRDRDTGTRRTVSARDHFRDKITVTVDRRCWRHLLETLGFDQLLDRQARDEFYKGINDTPPAFTSENCSSTFGHIWENRRDLYLRGIANTFAALDRRFRSHDGFKIGGRLIIERALSEGRSYWTDYNRRDTLRDVERVFRELDGLAPLSEGESIARRVTDTQEPTPFVLHGDYFRIRVFGNGNLHIWFERKDLLEQVNRLLAEWYGEVIGDAYDNTEADDAPQYHMTSAKEFGAFMSDEAVAGQVMRYAEISAGMDVLEPSAGTGMLARAAREAGGRVACVELQPGMAHELRVLHGFGDVREADFLSLSPRPIYDRIVMNPPFDRGRDCDHVRHAFGFLKPGGVLVAVMSARAEFCEDKRHKALHRIVEASKPAYGWRKWHDLPARSFGHAGTNINTVILAIRKPA